MNLSYNDIENLLTKYVSDVYVVDLIFNYYKLKKQLENSENQSWYFKQGIASKEQELWALAERFEKLRVLFNSSTIDCFIQKISDNNDYLSTSEGNCRGFNHRIVCSWKRNENDLFNELILLKSKTKFIASLEEYSKNPDELLKLIN